jgi:hypothetical protein
MDFCIIMADLQHRCSFLIGLDENVSLVFIKMKVKSNINIIFFYREWLLNLFYKLMVFLSPSRNFNIF